MNTGLSDDDYYDRNAEEYFHTTRSVDMSPLYSRFLDLVPPGAAILDAGCGSGRDAKRFIELGYRVTAMDASPKMAALAESYLGQPVDVLRFQDISYCDRFDGIWACASLLHVPLKELMSAFQRLRNALRDNGILYVSFKYGAGEYERDGRRFTHMNEDLFSRMMDQIGRFTEIDVWVSEDRRSDRADELWFNGLLRACVRRRTGGIDPDYRR